MYLKPNTIIIVSHNEMEFYDGVPNDLFEESSTNNGNILNDAKSLDRGYSKIWGFVQRSDGSLKRTKIDIYTTGWIGSNIRDAETGEYYKELVGSRDEDLFFKIKISSGELKSKNESNTLFYTSPDHCMRHLHCDIPQSVINQWTIKSRIRSLAVKK